MNKENILDACFEFVNNRIKEITLAIESADNSLKEDTKSSAGDKYETGREMIQQDLNRFQQQLALAEEDLKTLEWIRQAKPTTTVSLGSLIETNKDNVYFVAVSIGKLSAYPNVYVISPRSPIGQLLLGKQLGENVEFNKQSFILEKIS
ncbi:GreA/GreB family elongation factor [Sphingobacterium paucimobilis]|uniref:Uncharacterized protein n=1 Tax=Sphingobacterium paucimobilis HER1398 TaxID=1346330 RepID=U2H7D0_9SPHI|nr:GreA/GreB family elongation factor [Sphingobacterium paucimobilis]ERJ57596.1 hypothetical protein M472_02330 [Sphingobacterium paucimobilis HER1398]